MAAVKDILKHLNAEVAGRKRRCYHKRSHVILKGETCLVVRDRPQNQTTYCVTCAAAILAKADKTLRELRRQCDIARACEIDPVAEDLRDGR